MEQWYVRIDRVNQWNNRKQKVDVWYFS